MKVATVKKINHIPQLIAFLFMILFGVGFMALSLFVLNQKVPENYVKVNAEISYINEYLEFDELRYDVYINYTYNEQDYLNKEYNKYNSSMKAGDIVEIYVNPDNPEEFATDNSGDFIFAILSGAIILVGVIGVGYNIKKLVESKRSEK